MLPMQQIQRFLQVFGKSIALLWSAAPILTALLIIGQLLRGLAPAVSVWIVKQVVDTISIVLTQKVITYILCVLCVLCGLIYEPQRAQSSQRKRRRGGYFEPVN